MVNASRAILTASLAFNAAAPILAVPLFSTPGGTFLGFGNSGHGHLIRAPVGPAGGSSLSEPPPSSAPAAPASAADAPVAPASAADAPAADAPAADASATDAPAADAPAAPAPAADARAGVETAAKKFPLGKVVGSLLVAGALGAAIYGTVQGITSIYATKASMMNPANRAVDDETYLATGKRGVALSLPLEKKNDANFSVAQDK